MNYDAVLATCAALTLAGALTYWFLRAMIRGALADFKDEFLPELRSMLVAKETVDALDKRVVRLERKVFGEEE